MTTRCRIFLAHAREDKPRVRKLYSDLKNRGFDPWLDEVDLIPGQIWEEEIAKAIREAAVFLACLSSRSVDKRGHVQNEFRLALHEFGKRPKKSIYYIPVRLNDCDVPDLQIPELGLRLQAIQWVDLWEEGSLDRLVTAITHALAASDAVQRYKEDKPEYEKFPLVADEFPQLRNITLVTIIVSGIQPDDVERLAETIREKVANIRQVATFPKDGRIKISPSGNSRDLTLSLHVIKQIVLSSYPNAEISVDIANPYLRDGGRRER